MNRPNIIFMHAHNTGRYVEPYGHAVVSPNLMRLASEGVVFRQAFCAGPTCSPSRGSLMTGSWPHVCGMLGLGHRGFAMHDYGQHLAQHLKRGGYTTLLSGVEHTAPDISMVGYDRILSTDDTNYPQEGPVLEPAAAAVEFLESNPEGPFFLSIGLNETHRPFPKADPGHHRFEDPRYTAPIRPFPDTPETRADAADLKAAVRVMDENYGNILEAIDSAGLAGNTYVFCFTDHGLQFPRNMCNLTIHGTGVYFLARGPEHFAPGTVSDALVSLLDIYPTVCELTGVETPDHVNGTSLLPLLDGEVATLHHELFSEINYHAAYEPTRAIRTDRYAYIRRFDGRDRPVLPNIDDTPSKEFILAAGWATEPRAQVELYDRMFDPDELHNLADRDDLEDIRRGLEERLSKWMRETEDPLLNGSVPAPKGARVNAADGRSPKDPPGIVE